LLLRTRTIKRKAETFKRKDGNRDERGTGNLGYQIKTSVGLFAVADLAQKAKGTWREGFLRTGKRGRRSGIIKPVQFSQTVERACIFFAGETTGVIEDERKSPNKCPAKRGNDVQKATELLAQDRLWKDERGTQVVALIAGRGEGEVEQPVDENETRQRKENGREKTLGISGGA